MKDAMTDFPAVNCRQQSEISARLEDVATVGSCNGCVNRTEKVVTSLSVRGLTLRLCADCKAEVIQKLGAA